MLTYSNDDLAKRPELEDAAVALDDKTRLHQREGFMAAPVVLAAAQVTAGQLGPHTSNVKWENNILSFEIAEKYKGNFVPVVSHCHNVPYITSSHWIKQIGPEYIVVMQSAQDTSGRTYPPTDFTAVIVGLDK
jgi:hypothetical protein